MNALRDYIEAFKLDETSVLNLLQDHGIISDECVLAEEVGDAGKAISWISMHGEALPKTKQ